MSELKVRWIEVHSLPSSRYLKMSSLGTSQVLRIEMDSNVCDFCAVTLPKEGFLASLVDMVSEEKVLTHLIIVNPPWTICPNCTKLIGLIEGESIVSTKAVEVVYKLTKRLDPSVPSWWHDTAEIKVYPKEGT